MVVKAGYKQTEVGVIPADWDVVQLREVTNVTTGPFGSLLHERDYVRDGTPIITVEHLSEYGVVHSNLPMVSDFDKQRLKSYTLEENDIVFSRVGSVDRNSLISQNEEGWLFSGRLLRVRPNSKKIFSPFLSYQFHSEPFKSRVRSVAVGQTMASLNTQILKDITILLPPSSEQIAIAAALSDADALITALDKLIAKKRDIKQGAMQELLTGKKRLPGFGSGKEYKQTEVGTIPADWPVVKFSQICKKALNGGTPSTKISEYWEGTIPWITGADVVDQKIKKIRKFITEEAVKNSATNVVPKGNLLLVTRTGVGKVAIAPFDIAISQDLTGIIPTEDTSVEYLYWTFNRANNNLLNMNQGTSINGIKKDDLMNFPLSHPSLPEQTAIATILSDMDAEIAALERKRHKALVIKEGMMQELLTGRIRLV